MSQIKRLAALVAASVSVFLMCLSPGALSAAAVDPATAKLQSDVAALRERIAQLEGSRAPARTSVPASPANEVSARLQQLSQQVETISKVITISAKGVAINAESIELNATGKSLVTPSLLLSAPNIAVNAARNVTLTAVDQMELQTLNKQGRQQGIKIVGTIGTEEIALNSLKDIRELASNDLSADARHQMNLGGVGNGGPTKISIAGASLVFNNGTTPLVSVGSPRGSPTILAP
jgi:hypothetical protein